MTFKLFSGDKHDMKQKLKLTTKKISGRFFGDRHRKLDSEDEQDRQDFEHQEKHGRFYEKMTSPLIPVDFDGTDWMLKTVTSRKM